MYAELGPYFVAELFSKMFVLRFLVDNDDALSAEVIAFLHLQGGQRQRLKFVRS